jgi:hypothetical protein
MPFSAGAKYHGRKTHFKKSRHPCGYLAHFSQDRLQ